MATRGLVPRANDEGNIGTSLKNWLKGWFKDVYVSNTLTDGSNTATVANIKDAVDKKHSQNTDTGTTGNSFGVGDSADTNKTITAEIGQSGSQPALRYNVTSDEWEFSNDGSSYSAIGSGSGATGTRGTFTNATLSAGVLTITHSLGLSTPFTLLLTIADNNQKQIIPDEVTFLTNTITVDLSSYGTLSGTWGYYYI